MRELMTPFVSLHFFAPISMGWHWPWKWRYHRSIETRTS